MNRRRVLLGLTAGIPFLAGCSSYFDTNESSTETESPTTTTVAETARATATQTTMPTATTTPPSAPDTWPTETATATATEPDLAPQETYTNDRYTYTIEYPTGWKVDTGDPSAVTISSNMGMLRIEMMEDIPSSLTADDIAPVFLEGYKESVEEDGGSVEELDRQNQTLPNGHDSKVVDLRTEQSSNVLQQKILLTVVNGIGYVAVIIVPDAIHTSDVDENMEGVLLTLTISESNVQTEAPGVPV